MTPTDRTTATDAEFVARFAPFDPALAAPVLPVTAWLQQLDELRAAATPGPWHVSDGWDLAVAHDSGEVVPVPTDDADLIVAAVNNLPQLTAAVRAVLAVVDALDDSCEPGVRNLVDAPTVSRAIRAAIGSVTT